MTVQVEIDAEETIIALNQSLILIQHHMRSLKDRAHGRGAFYKRLVSMSLEALEVRRIAIASLMIEIKKQTRLRARMD